MKFENHFLVEMPPDRLFAVLQDFEQIAPCLPGAVITGKVDARTYNGNVTVSLGPITVTYRGTAQLLDANAALRQLTLRCQGRETRGPGSATATITVDLSPQGEMGASAIIRSDVTVTGKVAQFGVSLMHDVADQILEQFTRCLESRLATHAGNGPQQESVPSSSHAGHSRLGILGLIVKVLWSRLRGRMRTRP